MNNSKIKTLKSDTLDLKKFLDGIIEKHHDSKKYVAIVPIENNQRMFFYF